MRGTRALWGVLLGAALMSGCVRQAGDPFQPEAAQPLNDAPGAVATAELLAPPTADGSGDSSAISLIPSPTPLALTIISPSTQVASPTPLPTTGALDAAAQSAADAPTRVGLAQTPGGPPPPVEGSTPTPILRATETPLSVQASGPSFVGPTATNGPVLPSNEDGEGCRYTVRAGDTLYRVAVNNNITLAVLRQANPTLTGTDPILQIGDVLTIPGCGRGLAAITQTAQARVAAPSGSTGGGAAATSAPADDVAPAPTRSDGQQVHVVRSGDVLVNIATRYGVTVSAIVAANSLTNPNALAIGQELIIPAPAPTATATRAAG